MAVAGSLEIQLFASIARLQDDMNKATRSVGGAMSSIEKSVGFAQKALLGLGVGISFAALIGQVNKAVDTLAKLDDMAQKTGSSVENLSRLQKVASQFGQDFGAVDTAISKLAKGLAGIDDAGGKTAKALNAIGISQKFVKDNDPSQVLVQVAKNLQNYQDGASKAALATDLFGKAGVEILPYLNDLAENVDKFSGSSAKAAAEAAALQDRIGGFKVKIDEATTSITTALLPAFDQIITKFTEAVKEGGLLLGIIKSIGEIGKISLFGTDRSKQENMYSTTLPNAMAQIGRELKDQNLTSQERIKKQVELNFLAKEYNALAIQLGKVEKASPYVNPQGDKPKLGYMGEEAEKALAAARTSAAKEAEAARKKTNDEILKDIQKQIDFELELDEAKQKTKLENEKKQSEAAMKLQENAFEMDQKFIKALDKLETKFLDERTEKQLKAAEEVAKKQEELAKDINRSLTDALLRGFESGKSFAQNFKDTLINMFQTLILRPVISAVIDGSGITKLISGLSGGLASLFSGGANAGGLINNILPSGGASGGGIGGIGDLVSMGKTFFSKGGFQGALTSSIEGFGSSIVNGMGGIRDAIGGFVGANASMIGNILPFAGAAFQLLSGNAKGAAFTAAGAAIGSFIPIIGTALGGVIGSLIGSFFGGKDYKRYGTSVSGTMTTGGKYQQTGTGTIYDRRIAGVDGSLNNINEAFGKTLSTLFKAFDINSTIGTTSGMYQRGKSKKSGGIFDAVIDGAAIARVSVSLKKASLEQVYNALVEQVFGVGLVRAIQASKLSSDIKSLFDGFTKKEEVAGLIQAVINLNTAQDELASRFGITVDQSAQAAKATGLVGDALVGYVNKLATASIAFRSIGDSLIGTKSGILDVIGNSLGTVTTEAVTKLVARQVEVAAPSVQQRGFGMGGFTNGGGAGGFLSFVRPMIQTVTKTVYDSVTEYVDTITPVTAQLPTTLKGFDDLLKSINKNSAAGIKQFNDLFIIRDQFIQFTQAIDGLKGNVRGALFGMVSDAEKQQMLNEDLAKLFGDLGRTVPGSIDELIALGKSIDYTTAEGLNLASVFPTLVQAFNATQQAVDSLINSLRDANSFKTLVDFQRYQGVQNNYGTSFANSYVDNLPSFATGTNMLPSDMVANVHAGERIVPAADNQAIIQALNGDSEMKALLRDLITEVRSGNISIAQATQKTAKVMQRIDDEGVEIRETNNAGVRTVLDTRVVA